VYRFFYMFDVMLEYWSKGVTNVYPLVSPYKNAYLGECIERECRDTSSNPFPPTLVCMYRQLAGVPALSTYSTRIFNKTANSGTPRSGNKTALYIRYPRNSQKMHRTQRIMRSIRKSLRQMLQLLSGYTGIFPILHNRNRTERSYFLARIKRHLINYSMVDTHTFVIFKLIRIFDMKIVFVLIDKYRTIALFSYQNNLKRKI